MAGIYIHIPFCKQACNYCNFHFSTTLHLKTKLIASIVKEISLKKNFFQNNNTSSIKLDTIYFGGGTPSLLSQSELENILSEIYKNFEVDKDAEITLEANPDDLTTDTLKTLKTCGVNRLSIGIQTFDDSFLKMMNRAHTADEAIACLNNAFEYGFNDLNIDLIFGIPGMSTAKWELQLNKINAFQINHLSAYSLTVEPKTALAYQIEKNVVPPPKENLIAEQFLMASDYLSSIGYEHYELSNYAKDGHFAKHNTAYWLGKPYLGIGPSAHSYIYPKRSWNIANNAKYINAIENNIGITNQEVLSINDQFNEYLMTGLRTKWGIQINEVANRFGIALAKKLELNINMLDNSLYKTNNNKIVLTKKGWLWSDSIIADLMEVND